VLAVLALFALQFNPSFDLGDSGAPKTVESAVALKTLETGFPPGATDPTVVLLHSTDSTPLDEAERYGDFLTYPRGHAEVWEEYQRNGTVFPETEYEELPRGRVMYNTKTRLFTLLADRCILKRKALVTQIKKEMHLPKDTRIGGDNHYRCSDCLSRSE